jgi:superfamily II DNA or RNA helicase
MGLCMFDIKKCKNLPGKQNRYERRIKSLQSSGFDIRYIESTVNEAIKNIHSNCQSFVIYGEPQSGKTEMMIALTAKLLDEGHKIIIILLADNLHLLNQNLDRFSQSSLDPTPCFIEKILEEKIGDKNWIIFSKKNNYNLKKLIDKLHNQKRLIILDDEADNATPNAKINKDERTAINDSIDKLLGTDGTYIGVTATPARLDLNHTFNNMTEK